MKDKINLTRGWLAKADSDLVTAHKLIDIGGPYDTACFHIQQAIEKFLKAFLVFHEKPVPKIHDLEELQRRCISITNIPDLAGIDFSEITDFAIEMRYDIEFWPEIDDATQSITIARKVREIIIASLPESCRPK